MRRRSSTASEPTTQSPTSTPTVTQTSNSESEDIVESVPQAKNEKSENNNNGGGGGGLFECNICFDVPRDPVVTQCGHLYCWGCLWRWMRQRAGASQCPVCKAPVARDTVTPIYGRGRASSQPQSAGTEANAGTGSGDVPPRPAGHRPTATAGGGGVAAAAPGIHPYWHPAANAYAGAHGNLALATFGNFPSLFGMEIAYPQFNEQAADGPRLTPEQETREQVAKVGRDTSWCIGVVLSTWVPAQSLYFELSGRFGYIMEHFALLEAGVGTSASETADCYQKCDLT